MEGQEIRTMYDDLAVARHGRSLRPSLPPPNKFQPPRQQRNYSPKSKSVPRVPLISAPATTAPAKSVQVRPAMRPRPTARTFPLPARPAGGPARQQSASLAEFGGPALPDRQVGVQPGKVPRPRPNLVHTPRHIAPEQAHGALQLPSGKRRRQVKISIIIFIVAITTLVLGAVLAILIELT